MIFFRSAAVVPAQRAACARPAAAFPPRRPSDTAAGSFLFFLAMGVILSSGRRTLAMGSEGLDVGVPPQRKIPISVNRWTLGRGRLELHRLWPT